MKFLIKPFIFSSLFLLAACAHWNSATTPTPMQFTAEGLVGVKSARIQESAHFTWIQNEDAYSIDLYGPLALGSTYVEGDPQSVTLTLSDQESYTAHSPETLMQENLGWSLPVQGLQYWLWGQAVPDIPATSTKNAQGKIATLIQQGWTIDYVWQNALVPHKLTLERPGMRVVIVINSIE